MKSSTFKHIEAELESYWETKRDLARMEMDVILASPSEPLARVAGDFALSDPTGRRATVLALNRRINEMRRIVAAIETVLNNLDAESRKLVELRYFQRMRPPQVARELGIDERTFYRWRKRIVYAVAAVLGWD